MKWIRFLQIEWYKIRYYRTANIFLFLYLLLFFLIIFTINKELSAGAKIISLENLSILKFPLLWHFISFIATCFKIFIILIITANITNEFSYNTIKLNLISGLSKIEFIQSKVLLIFIISLFFAVLIFIAGLTVNLVNADNINYLFDNIEFILLSFLDIFTFLCICLFICILCKKNVLAIMMIIFWKVAETILYLLETGFINNGVFANSFSKYLPFNTIYNLITQPFSRAEEIQRLSHGFLSSTYYFPWSMVFLCLFYSLLFIWLSYILLKKNNI